MPDIESQGRINNALIGAQKLLLVTPNDSVDLPGGVCEWLWVGGAGAISIIAEDDTNPVLVSGVPAGTKLDIRAKRVRATGTVATLIVACY